MMRVSKKVSGEIIKKSFLPVFVLFLFIGLYVFYKINIVPTVSPKFHQEAKKYIGTVFIICIGFIIQRIVGAALCWYNENIASKTATQLDDKLIPLLRKVLKLVIWVIAFLIILPVYGVDILALITALGVGSLAIALAAQDTIANIIAGFMIMIDSPFRIGDNIKLPSGEPVKVLDIGVRRSKFLSEDNKAIIIVPNLELSKSKIINFTYGQEKLNKKEIYREGPYKKYCFF